MYFVISDVHGCITALENVLSIYEQGNYEGILLLGDVLNHGPRNPLVEIYDPKACIDVLNQYRQHIIAVRGNCDSEVDQMVLNFPILADMAVVQLGKRRVVLSHGHLYQRDASDAFFADGDIYLHGHFHVPQAEVNNGKVILNPGSITLPKEGYKASYGELTQTGFAVKDFEGNTLKDITF